MGKRGPKGKSPELDAKQGFPSRRKAKAKAAISAETPKKQIQLTNQDSPNVPPPPAWLSKAARHHWATIFSDPANSLHYKSSDHFIIAMYCDDCARLELLKKCPPRATLRHRTTAGHEVTKPNPKYRAMRELAKDIERTSALLFRNPQSRMTHSAKLMHGDGTKTPAAPPASPHAPTGPLGILKRPATHAPAHAPSPATPSSPPPGTKPN